MNSHAISGCSSDQVVTLTTELRKVPIWFRNRLCQILDSSDSWEELAAVICHPDDSSRFLFTHNNISVLKAQKNKPGGSPAQALFTHWSTTGKNRPTVNTLLDLLKETRLYRAADFVAVQALQGSPVEKDYLETRELLNIVSSSEDTEYEHGITSTSHEEEKTVLVQGRHESGNSESHTVPGESNADEFQCVENSVVRFSYQELSSMAQNFSETSVSRGGAKLGEGGFAVVYRGTLKSGQSVAIKRFKGAVDGQFSAELRVLALYRHSNLLPLLGYSCDGPSACLVYAYMKNGCLYDRIMCKDNSQGIPWKRRLNIALGTARGISYLHTARKEPLVHRDIKSANVLLDEQMNPRVGDFGLVRIGSSGERTTVVVTNTVMGTNCYMAPEAMRGDVSVKLDTFSFGIVLLELLTGLPPLDNNREERDLLTHIQNFEEELTTLLDTKAGETNEQLGKEMFDLALKCCRDRKKDRPTMVEVLHELEELLKHL
ncbi:interleukin-1 receptor-associated kinase 4-like isoform X2 [Limulus polyphemus]|nr:interleukin-1 receptor-associated kinase 4-like isoform X2 [Limulus polyphemus]